MAIIFKEREQEFHLYNQEISYVFCVLPNGQLGHLYYGKRISPELSYQYLFEGRQRSLTSCVYEDDDTFSLQHTRQEYACYGTGDVLLPAFEIEQSDGSRLSNFVFQHYRILKGKPHLSGLPQTYVEDENEADTLEIDLYDKVSETKLCLVYTIFKQRSVITRSARFTQVGKGNIKLQSALSMNLDLPDKNYEWLHLDGAWGRERHLHTAPLHQGTQAVYSLKGASSAEHNPFLALRRPHTTEHSGEVLGFSLVYSGNFIAQVDVTPFHQTRVSLGIHPKGFTWLLEQGEIFQSPEVVMVYSKDGLNGMSQIYHDLYRKRLCRGEWRDKERPIILNNWEAMTFDFDENRIMVLAEKAAAVGVELFVMDDGWFGARNHDRAGLGDWTVNQEKLPSGIKGISDKIHNLGMKFGLWIEPEMVNKDSNLYRQHPDWILHHPNHSQSQGRHQYTLDLSREEVYQNIYHQLHELLANNGIDYIKWDMNRYMSEVYSVGYGAEQQGEIFHRYLLNVYRLYETLTTEFPHVLFESCSSGGARFDPGMLYYAPQTWCSDNSDGIDRLKIQYGTSLVYPLSSISCHVSEVPNQQVGRLVPLRTRANVAYFGSFGYELDLSELSEEEIELVCEQISFYKRYRSIFQYGKFTRLLSPFEQSVTAWQVMDGEGDTIFVGLYRSFVTPNGASYERLRLTGLEHDAYYKIGEEVYTGSALMNVGLVIKQKDFKDGFKDFTSVLFEVRKITS